jgi:branched-chain amino acid aminotransferase
MEEIVYLNGNLVPHSQAILSPFDYGFLFGYGLFETMRSYDGVIFRLGHHLDRLFSAADALGLGNKLTNLDLKHACYEVMNANGLSDARVRLAVSAGEGDMVVNPATCRESTLFIAAQKLTSISPERYERGSRAIIASIRRNSHSPIARLKTSCFLENILAKGEARSAGVDETIVLNEKDLVAEGSSSNIFLVFQRELHTPSPGSGILPGITRGAILELANSLGIPARERDITRDELFTADEAFYTTSVTEVMPLTEIEGRPVGSGGVGSITRGLMEAYRDMVLDAVRRKDDR